MAGREVDDRFEVYPNPPLQLVAMELRYPYSPRLATPDAIAFFHEHLSDLLPLVEPLSEQVLMFVGSPQGADSPPRPPAAAMPPTKSLFRLESRSKTTAVNVSGANTIIETSNYERYGTFRRLVDRVLTGLAEFGHPIGVERVGLRYIDEIRIPSVQTAPGEWSRYIHPALLAAKDIGTEAHGELSPSGWQGVLQYARGANMGVVMRYGALQGFAVNPEGPLRLAKRREPGPFFLIDVDSYWVSGDEEIEEFSSEHVLSRCDTLHRPIRAIFERSVTEALRDEVLRRDV